MFTQELKKTFHGAGALIITPFHDDLSLNCDGIRTNMAHMIADGLSKEKGFFVTNGSMGECSSMTMEERKRVIRTTVECAGDIPVVAGVNDTSVMNVIELARYAAQVGAKAILLAPPYYHVYDLKQIIGFYRYVHDHTTLPIMLYNNPGICGVDIPIRGLLELAKLDRVFAIKQATVTTTNFVQSQQLNDQLLVFAASSSQQPYALLNDAVGFISFLSSINMKLQLRLWDAICQRDWEEAIRCHQEEMKIYGWWWNGGVKQQAGQIVHMKKAMDMLGLCGGAVRPPLMQELSSEEIEGLQRILVDWNLL